jgi:hypothetical protein
MVEEFSLNGFRAGRGLIIFGDQILSEIAAEAPNSKKLTAVLEKKEDGFSCEIEVYSELGVPISAKERAKTPKAALRDAAAAIKNRMIQWRSFIPQYQTRVHPRKIAERIV